MSTEDLERKSSQTGGFRRLNKPGTASKPATQNLVEQVPPWLKHLLSKYGEREGPLVGLGESSPGPAMAMDEVEPEGSLSALLDQMAQEDDPAHAPPQRVTSVEWGVREERPEASVMDDFLTALSSGQADYEDSAYPPAVAAPDWITSAPQPADSAIEDEAPDWLTDMMLPGAVPEQRPPATPMEAPDWLTEALGGPTPQTQLPPSAPVSPPPASDSGSDVPDWLTAALGTPTEPPAPSAPALPSAPDESDFDVPGWLTEAAAEPALPETFAGLSMPAPSPETPYDVDVPDWLQDIVTPPGLEITEGDEAEAADVPDWLASIVPPDRPSASSAVTPEMPAWDAPDEISPETAEQPPVEAKPAASATPNWFAQGESLPSLDWLFQGEAAPASAPETETPQQDSPDWIFDASTPPSAATFEPPEITSPATAEALPSWLDDLPVSTAAEAESETIPDWLTNLQDEVDAPGPDFDPLAPGWPENLPADAPDIAAQTGSSWPADIEEETPSWLAETEAAPFDAVPPAVTPPVEEEPSLASPPKNLKPLKRFSPQPAPEADVEPALPDWAAGSDAEQADMAPPHPVAETPAADAPADEVEPVAAASLDWLNDLPANPAEAPDWMAEAEQTSAGSSDWLSNLTAKADETPDWMAELQATAEFPASTDDWPAEESSAEEVDLLAARLDWFTQGNPPETSPTVETSPVGLEVPDWLTNDLAEISPAVPDTPAAEKLERVDWLNDLPTPPAAEGPSASMDEVQAMADMEIPSWLADIPEEAAFDAAPPAPESQAEAEEELSWLRELPEPAPTDSPMAFEVEEEPEGPAWLTGLPEAVTPSAPPETAEAELETLPWLVNSSDEDAEPSWVNDLTESPVERAMAAPLAFDFETETEEELETPAWLTDLLESADPQTASVGSIEADEPEAEPEPPPWLAEWPSATARSSPSIIEEDTDMEMPAWLTGLQAASEGDKSPATVVEESDKESDLEAPPWLIGLSETALIEQEQGPEATSEQAAPVTAEEVAAPVEATEAELEIPSWLVELPDMPPAEAETETEIPAWLSQSLEASPVEAGLEEAESEADISSWLSELPAETAPAASVETTEPAEMPSWLSGLRHTTTPEVEAEPDETPDWLADLAETPEATVAPTAAEAELEETPAWLSDISEFSETVTGPERPAWLSDLPETPEVEPTFTAPVEAVEEEETSEIPTWMSELPAEPEASQPVETAEPPELEIPLWLAGVAGATAGAVVAEVSDLIAPHAEEETAAPVELETPAWLADFSTAPLVEESLGSEAVEVEAQEETPSWLVDLPAEAEPEAPLTETGLDRPSWLSDLPEAPLVEPVSEAGIEEADTETELEIPDWLTGLRAPTDVALETETKADLETPWLSKMPAVPTTELTEPETELEAETPSWLAGLPDVSPAVEAEIDQTEAEPDTLAWLSDLPETTEAEAAAIGGDEEKEELVIPSWLADLPGAVEAEPAPIEPVEASETQFEMPAWLSELPESSMAGDITPAAEPTEADLEMPSWLTELPQASQAEEIVSTPEALELEMPSWLTELPQASQAEETVSAPEASELEMPSWLTELSEGSAAEPEQAGLDDETQAGDESEAEAELEIPPWLADLRGVPASETTAGAEAALTEAETPAWLSELPQTVEVESIGEAATGEETSPWLKAEAASTPPVEESETEEELVIPSWLTGAVAPKAADAAETVEEETPSWLTDLSGAIETEPATPVAAEEMETETETEFEIPSWLNELPPAPEAEPTVSVEESESPELEIPLWLAGIGGVTAGAAVAELESIAEAETPDRLAESAELTEAEESPSVWVKADATEVETDTPGWLSALAAPSEVEASPAEMDEISTEIGELAETEEEEPSWLADLSMEELKLPSWLSDVPEFAAAPAEVSEAETEVTGPIEPVAAPEDTRVDEPTPTVPPAEEIGETGPPPESNWLAGLGAATAAVEAAIPGEETGETFVAEAEPEQPSWLTDTPKTAVVEAPAPSSPAEEGLKLPDIEPEAPDWLKDLSDDPVAPLAAETLRPPVEPRLSPAERMSDWLRKLEPSDATLTHEDDQVAESTGVLAGLAPLLPVEKITAPAPLLDPQATASTAQADAMLEAAHHFYAIATQLPQPAALPEPLTRQDRLLGNVLRGALYLLLIILVALPLIPGLQKVIDPVTGQKVPWTEPAGALSQVLDKQRRELISVQMGVIDLQQPGSVALVSFDYTAATQGEMQPLAEAIIGRLRGQGMRLIFTSLEPEGAALAQRTLDQILAERDETYGTDMLNLGYIPGQIAGIRELVTGRKQLSALADFKEGLTFAAPERAGWSSVNNLGQVDVIITLSDNPVVARWWIEQMAAATPPDDGERFLLAATSATADPFLRPYLDSQQLNGLISGINGAAAIEAGRKDFGPARQMLDSQSIAHLLIVILIALGTMVGWMPAAEVKAKAKAEAEEEAES